MIHVGVPAGRRVVFGLSVRQTWAVVVAGLTALFIVSETAASGWLSLVLGAAVLAAGVLGVALRVGESSLAGYVVARLAWQAGLDLARWRPVAVGEQHGAAGEELAAFGLRLRVLELEEPHGVLVAASGERAAVIWRLHSSVLGSLHVLGREQASSQLASWRGALEALGRAGASRLQLTSLVAPLALDARSREREVAELVRQGIDERHARSLVGASREGMVYLAVQARARAALPGLAAAVPDVLRTAGVVATPLAPSQCVEAVLRVANPYAGRVSSWRATWDALVVEDVVARTGVVVRWPRESVPLTFWHELVRSWAVELEAAVATHVVVEVDDGRGARELEAVAASAARGAALAARQGRVLDLGDDLVVREAQRVQAGLLAGRSLVRVAAAVTLSVPRERAGELPRDWRVLRDRAAAAGVRILVPAATMGRTWSTWTALAGLVEEDPWLL